MPSLFERLNARKGRRSSRKQERKPRNVSKKHKNLDKRLVSGLSEGRVPSMGQMKYIGKYLSPKERQVITGFTWLIILGVAMFGYNYASNHIATVPAEGGEYVEASIGAPHFVNPVLASTNDADLDIISMVFSGLMKTDLKGELIPDLAESYAISEEGTQYTFTLRDDAQWHDGTAFLARDVVFSFDAIKNTAWQSPLNTRFQNVVVEAPDELTVVFTLSEPFTPFLSLLTVGIIPEHLWQDIKPENAGRATLNVKPIGTGPYRFKNFTMDKKGAIRSYSLEVSDNYYGEHPFITSIVFKYYQDFAEATEAYLARKVDGLSFLPLEFREDVDTLQTSRVYTLRLPQYTSVFFNQKENPFLSSRSVRQALAYAVDRNEILENTLGDNGVPVYGPIPPGFIGFHADIEKYAFSLAAADELLVTEGWEVDEVEGVRMKDLPDPEDESTDIPTPLQITLTTVDTQENITVAQTIKRSWEAIGVKTELEIVPASKIQKDIIRTRDYESLLYGEILGQDPDPYPFWHSSQNQDSGLNLAIFSNRRVDELLEKGRTTRDVDQRTDLYVQFQDLLAEEVPAIFLYSPTYTYVANTRVKGVSTKTIFEPADRFTDIADWYIETKRVFQ